MKQPTFKFIATLALAIGLLAPTAQTRADELRPPQGEVLLAQSDGRWSCRDLHGWKRERCQDRRHDRRQDRREEKNVKDAVALGLFGLAVGAIVAGAAKDAEDKRQDEINNRRAWIARCSARYRSFDAKSGTFIGNDGRRYFCR